MGKILQGSNITITSWARSSREQSNYYTIGKILQGSNLTITWLDCSLEDLAHDVMVRLLPWRILPMV
jgi:hypothetical protein